MKLYFPSLGDKIRLNEDLVLSAGGIFDLRRAVNPGVEYKHLPPTCTLMKGTILELYRVHMSAASKSNSVAFKIFASPDPLTHPKKNGGKANIIKIELRSDDINGIEAEPFTP